MRIKKVVIVLERGVKRTRRCAADKRLTKNF